MLTPQQVLNTYYLEIRCGLLETAAFLDRYDEAVKRDGTPAGDSRKLETLRRALALLAAEGNQGQRAELLLELFAEIET